MRLKQQHGQAIATMMLIFANKHFKPLVSCVSYQMRMKADWVADWQEWKECGEDAANDYINTPRLNDWSFEVRKLYALGESNE